MKHEKSSKTEKTHTFFLKILRWNDAEMEFEECLGQFQLRDKWGRQWTVIKIWGKNWKSFKNCLWNAKHVFFATDTSRQGHPPKHFKPKNLKKFAKCFSQLEVSLTRESWAEPRKSLRTPHDTFHLRTSHQTYPASSRL